MRIEITKVGAGPKVSDVYEAQPVECGWVKITMPKIVYETVFIPPSYFTTLPEKE